MVQASAADRAAVLTKNIFGNNAAPIGTVERKAGDRLDYDHMDRALCLGWHVGAALRI